MFLGDPLHPMYNFFYDLEESTKTLEYSHLLYLFKLFKRVPLLFLITLHFQLFKQHNLHFIKRNAI